MRLWPLFSTVALGAVLASPARGDRPGGCLDSTSREGGLYRIVRRMKIGEAGRPSVDVNVRGVQALDEAALWELVAGERPTRLTIEQAAVFLDRLEGTRLFAKFDLTVQVREDGATLDVAVVEHPVVKGAVLRGIDDEAHRQDLLEALLEQPPQDEDDEEDEGCPAAVPREEWLARLDGEEVRPGIVWDGLAGGLERVTRKLYDDGYQMASVAGRLDAQGLLTLDVDQGRIESVEVVGVHPRLVEAVRRELRLEPGRVFLMADATAAVHGLKTRFPFLEPTSARRPTRSLPGLSIEPEDGAGLRLVAVEAPAHKEETYVQVDGRRVILHLKPRSAEFTLFEDDDELIHHTAVTGYTPGLTVRRRVWDPGNRAHLTLEGDVNASLRDDHVEWLAGTHLTLPGLSIAELGFQFHDFSDTSDRWRIDRVNSYVDSMFGSGRRTDYFRRKGFSAFLTGHFAERVTAGVEYRIDQYGAQSATLDVDAGDVGSLVFRGEWSTVRRSTTELTGLWRHPETSLFQKGERSTLVTGFRTLATVEVARTSLGSDREFRRVVSDSVLTLAFSRVHGVRIRGRVAGGSGLPPVREEALGGWSALRGYRMKEFRGDWSVLGMIEYRVDWLSGFIDVGSVRQPAGWIDPVVGVGGKLHLGEDLFVTAAWRTDELAKGSPEIRLFFNREF